MWFLAASGLTAFVRRGLQHPLLDRVPTLEHQGRQEEETRFWAGLFFFEPDGYCGPSGSTAVRALRRASGRGLASGHLQAGPARKAGQSRCRRHRRLLRGLVSRRSPHPRRRDATHTRALDVAASVHRGSRRGRGGAEEILRIASPSSKRQTRTRQGPQGSCLSSFPRPSAHAGPGSLPRRHSC
jgi:hypothetical protein